MTWHFIIHTDPVPKQRPRFGNGRTYTPQKTKDAEAVISDSIRYHEDCPKTPTKAPLEAIMTFYMPMPASWSDKKRYKMRGEPHTQRPDVDNLTKLVADSLNGILVEDDAQLWSIEAKKIWSDKGRIELQFYETSQTYLDGAKT